MQLSEQTGASDTGNENGLNESSNARETASEFSVESVLLGKPRRYYRCAFRFHVLHGLNFFHAN